MKKETFWRFANGKAYRKGGIIHTQGYKGVKHVPFKRNRLIDLDDHLQISFDVVVPYAHILALTTEKPKEDKQLPTNPKPLVH